MLPEIHVGALYSAFRIIFDEFLFIDFESHDLFGAIGSYKIFLYEENAAPIF
jgi:hypothetical protein